MGRRRTIRRGCQMICNDCKDAARTSLANEIREGLRLRGYWAPLSESDLICAVFAAIERARNEAVKAEREAWYAAVIAEAECESCAKVADAGCRCDDASEHIAENIVVSVDRAIAAERKP